MFAPTVRDRRVPGGLACAPDLGTPQMNAPANINHAALCNIELEQEILGSVVTHSAFEVIERAVSAGDFSEPLHSQLFETFASVHASHGLITPALVIASLGGEAGMIVAEGITLGQYIARLAAAASLPRNATAYAKQIREFSNRRKGDRGNNVDRH